MNFRPRLISFGILIALSFASTHARSAIVLDRFDRPDSSDVGPGWVTHEGGFSIEDGRLSSSPRSRMTFQHVKADGVAIDVRGSAREFLQAEIDLQYLYPQNRTMVLLTGRRHIFDSVDVYSFNDHGIFNSRFWHIDPIEGGLLSARLVGDTVVVKLDEDRDGKNDLAFWARDIVADGLGNRVGIGGYGKGIIDNFAVITPVPSPLHLLAAALGALALWARICASGQLRGVSHASR